MFLVTLLILLTGGYITHAEDGADPVGMRPFDTIFNQLLFTGIIERERRFLSNLRSDWLDDAMIEDNSPGTCEWVLFSEVFQAWLSGSEKVLWIQGNAGAGKTVLAKFLYRQLCDVVAGGAVNSGAHVPEWLSSASGFPSRSRKILAYFLDVNSPLRNSGLSVLHSLLYQILSTEPELFRYIHGKRIFSRPQRGDFGQYAEVLSAVLRDQSLRGTIIVLDALDECGAASQLKIIDMLMNLADQSSIQLLVTSRPNQSLNLNFLLDLSGSVEHLELDIKSYVKTAIRRLAEERGFSEDLRDTITQRILARSPEGFLWVQLVLQSISKARTARMVRLRLEQLPQDLREAYADCLNGTTDFTDVSVRRTLYFVMIAEAPLQVKDLSALLALSQAWEVKRPPNFSAFRTTLDLKDIIENQTMNFEQDFKKNFQPLLSLNESSVSLVHYSLQEFLMMPSEIDKFHATFGMQSLEDGYPSDLRAVHGTMAVLCLQYMLAAFLRQDDPLNFLDFACFNWMEHARKAGGVRSFRLDYLVTSLFSQEQDYASRWLSRVATTQVARFALLPSKAEIAFVFAAFDLGSHFGEMLGISVEPLESTDQEQRTPLHLAAANNSVSSVRWIQSVLSAAGKNLGDLVVRKDSNGESPISLAAQNGHGELMRLLLVSMMSKHEFDPHLFKNTADYGNVEMFETLYDYTNIKTPDQGMSLLTYAARLNSVKLMERISSDHGGPDTTHVTIAASLRDSSGNPLLHIALRRQASQVFEYLLHWGYPAAVTDGDGNTALHIAAQEANEGVAEKLINVGVSVNSINNGGETPLHIASRIGLRGMVRLLCDYGANVNLRGSSGCLPAHLAAETGQEALVDILLQYGTNIDATDDIGRSALHVAAGAGQEPTLGALLMRGADVNVLDDEERTPVHYAVQSGNLSILYMLCEAGADLSASESSNMSPLHLAAKNGSEILVRELIRLGTDPNPQDLEGRTPLHYSCLSERSTMAVVRILLEAGSYASALDYRKISPIHLAAEQGFATLVRALASHGADLNCGDLNGMTPLHYSCRSSRPTFSAAKLLIESGAQINTLDHHGLSPLHHACLSEHMNEEVVRILLENGAHVNQQNNDGNMPLHYAMKKENFAIIKLLRESGAKMSKDEDNKWEALGNKRPGTLESIGFVALDRGAVVEDEMLFGRQPK